MKQVLSLVLAGTFIMALLTAAPVGAQETAPPSPVYGSTDSTPNIHKDPPGELIIADALILRPLGIAACAIGLVGALVVAPFSAATNSFDRVNRQLINVPFNYTFTRPLGQMEYEDASDPSCRPTDPQK
jgi:hypothetical protein